ncbi:MAG: hypothetical protein AAFQ34_09715 [Pseudomonadota bacterium]
MGYDQIDWDQERPTAEAVQEAWKNLSITPMAPTKPLTDIEEALSQTRLNGWVICRQFELGESEVLHWFFTRNRLDEADFFSEFFNRNEVKAQVAKVGQVNDLLRAFEMRAPFTALGTLTDEISSGGAYEEYDGSVREVLALMSRFAGDALDEALSQTPAWTNWKAWAEGFCDVAWDASFLFFHKEAARVTLVLMTDTD